MHAPFALPIAVGAYYLYGQPADPCAHRVPMTRLSRALVIGFCVLYGVIAFATGGCVMVSGAEAGVDPMTDNTSGSSPPSGSASGSGSSSARAATGRRPRCSGCHGGPVPRRHRSLGRAALLPGDDRVGGLIALELVPPLFLVPMQAALARGDALDRSSRTLPMTSSRWPSILAALGVAGTAGFVDNMLTIGLGFGSYWQGLRPDRVNSVILGELTSTSSSRR